MVTEAPHGDSDMEICTTDKLAEKPVVSVLMVTYNHGEYLAEAIESIVTQKTDFEFELIIGEDCSSDNTREIAFDYQKLYPHRIRVVYSASNVGMSRNFNRIYSRCKGEFIAICDGDDYWNDNNKLQRQVDTLRLNPDCVVTYHDVVYLSTLNEAQPRSVVKPKARHGYSGEQLLRYAHMPTVSMCFRNVIREFPEEKYMVINGDTFLISMMGDHGRAIFMDDIQPAVYREHRGGIWSPLSREEKRNSTITTFFWLAVYHERENRNKISSHHALTAMTYVLETVNMDRKMFLKWFLIKYFPRSYNFYKTITSKLNRKFDVD